MLENQPLNILYLVTLSESGGAQKYIFDLATALDKKHKVSVACGGAKDGDLIRKLRKLNIQVYYLKNLQRPVNFYRDWFALGDIVRLFKQVKPDVVHLNSSKAGSLGAIAARMCSKVCKIKKVIYTVHGLVLNEPLSPPKKIFYWIAEWLSAKFKTDLICVSEFDKKSLLRTKVTRQNKISVIYNGIELKNMNFFERTDARERLAKLVQLKLGKTCDTGSKAQLIGTVANFYTTKGFNYLIEAVKQTKPLLPNAHFMVVGDGPERGKMTELINDYKLNDTIYLLGIIDNAAQYLKAFDLFVLPSVKEGLAYTLIEARAAGLPIITTRVGGNAEIVENNKNGMLVPPKDFSAVSDAVVNLIQNESLRKAFSANSKTDIDKFDLGMMVEKTEKIYLN